MCVFFRCHAVSRTQQFRQRESSVKTLRILFFADFWRHFLLSGGNRSEETENIKFSRVEIEPTICHAYSHTLCLCATTGLICTYIICMCNCLQAQLWHTSQCPIELKFWLRPQFWWHLKIHIINIFGNRKNNAAATKWWIIFFLLKPPNRVERSHSQLYLVKKELKSTMKKELKKHDV